MEINHPSSQQIPQLLSLWKHAFGEHNGFWELFLDTGFASERCRCIIENEQITAALCWLDCLCNGQKLAYVYAVVTHPDHRNRGLCRTLLAETQAHLKNKGYSSVLLVPESPPLRKMYEKLGYRECTQIREFTAEPASASVFLRAIGPGEYAQLRRSFLPPKGVIQEAENLRFLAEQVQFYAGETFLLAAYAEKGTLYGMELLGDSQAAPGILRALDCIRGHFRVPGTGKSFAMIHPLQEDAVIPEYFGFAFD